MAVALLIASIDSSIAAVSPPVIVKADQFSPLLVKTGAGAVSVKAGTTISVNGVVVPTLADTPVSMPTLVAGTDYRVVIKADGSFQAIDYSTAIPTGGAVIGGFHYLPGGYSTGYDQGGNTTPTVLEWSFWDLNYRPNCPDPRGMTKIGKSGLWVDIYFVGDSYAADGVSRNNQPIVHKTNPAIIPADYGGNGTLKYSGSNWWEANEVVRAWGKRLPSYEEMTLAAFGTNEEAGRGAHPVKTGLNTANNPAGSSTDANFTSKWGLIQSTGVMWIWTSTLSDWEGEPAGGANGFEAYGVTSSVQGSRGKILMQNSDDLTALLHGGSSVYRATSSGSYLNIAGLPGSRATETIEKLWDNSENIAIRGACDHIWR